MHFPTSPPTPSCSAPHLPPAQPQNQEQMFLLWSVACCYFAVIENRSEFKALEHLLHQVTRLWKTEGLSLGIEE